MSWCLQWVGGYNIAGDIMNYGSKIIMAELSREPITHINTISPLYSSACSVIFSCYRVGKKGGKREEREAQRKKKRERRENEEKRRKKEGEERIIHGRRRHYL